MNLSLSRRGLVAGGALVAANFAVGGAATALDGRPARCDHPARRTRSVFARCACVRPLPLRLPARMRAHRHAGGRAAELAHARYGLPPRDLRLLRTLRGRRAPPAPSSGVSGHESRIGVAVIDGDRCIGWIQGSCRVCVDACPYDAMSTDASGRPVVDATRCNGCGICEYRCPSNTYRSFSGGTRRGINVEKVEA